MQSSLALAVVAEVLWAEVSLEEASLEVELSTEVLPRVMLSQFRNLPMLTNLQSPTR